MESMLPRRDADGRGGRPDFVEFRNRIQRLVESLVALRSSASSAGPRSRREEERVEVKIESAAIIVEFFIAELSWETASELAHHFQSSFAKFAPVFLDAPTGQRFKLAKSGEKEGSYRQLYIEENTFITIQWDPLNAGYSVLIETNLNDFNDHFEAFATDTARTLFPAIETRAHKKATDLESWYKEFGRDFEKMGCRVLRESALGWKDLAGLAHLRERLERSVFLPLAREQLYQKVARRVMPHPANVLPRGVLLYGPPGCGKTWSMRVIAGEAGLPVVVLPCEAVLTKWYGESENRLARVFAQCREAGRMILLIDEIDALAKHRKRKL